MWQDKKPASSKVRTYGGAGRAKKLQEQQGAKSATASRGGERAFGKNLTNVLVDSARGGDEDEDDWLAPSSLKKKGSAACEVRSTFAQQQQQLKGDGGRATLPSSETTTNSKKKKSSLAALLKEGRPRDLSWLVQELRLKNKRGARFVGFGHGVSLSLPRGWDRKRQAGVIAWCEDLGFRCVVVAASDSTLLETGAKQVEALESEIAKLLLAAKKQSSKEDGGGVEIYDEDEEETPDVKKQSKEDSGVEIYDEDEETPDVSKAAESEDRPQQAESHPEVIVEEQEAADKEEEIIVIEEEEEQEAAEEIIVIEGEEEIIVIEEEEEETAPADREIIVIEEKEEVTVVSMKGAILEEEEEDQSRAPRVSVLLLDDEEDEGRLLRRRRTACKSRLRRASSLARQSVSHAPMMMMTLPPSSEASLGRRKTIIAKEQTGAAAPCVGAWISGEIRRGCVVVDCRGWAEAESLVLGVDDKKLRVASKKEEGDTYEVDISGAEKLACWPSGFLYVLQGETASSYFVSASLTGGRDCLTASVVRRILEMLGDEEQVRAVSSIWLKASRRLEAQRLGELVLQKETKKTKRKNNSRRKSWNTVAKKHPAGKYLAEGAFKRVYRVGGEAMSVADLGAISDDREEAEAAARELEICAVLSELVKRDHCPNYVATLEAFECDRAPAPGKWISKNASSPTTLGKKGRYLYTRMELCGHGDLEEWLRREDSLPADVAIQLLFQVCFALYAARADCALRHFDLKLLNVLAMPLGHAAVARYDLGSKTYRLPMLDSGFASWAKLADFGTSKIGSESLYLPPKPCELFTTLENSPVELLTHGDDAERACQFFAKDTFSLGIAALHLIGGLAPYEELMQDATCPRALRRALSKVWLAKPHGTQKKFTSLARTLRDYVGGEEENVDPADFGGESVDPTLYDTLYRFLVLIGPPTDLDDDFFASSPVWTALKNTLGLTAAGTPVAAPEQSLRRPKRGAAALMAEEARQCFERDSRRFSLDQGDHPAIERTRSRLKERKAEGVLRSMLHFDPAKRPTMLAILTSPLFAKLVDTPELLAQDTPGSSEGVKLYSFAAYRRAPESNLPIPDL